jgi:hypothetical protein
MLRAYPLLLFETLISEYENGNRKAPRSTLLEEQFSIDSTLFYKEWNCRQEKRMDGIYSDFPSVVREILNVIGHDVDDKIIEILHKERITAKTIPFSYINKAIIQMLDQIKEFRTI